MACGWFPPDGEGKGNFFWCRSDPLAYFTLHPTMVQSTGNSALQRVIFNRLDGFLGDFNVGGTSSLPPPLGTSYPELGAGEYASPASRVNVEYPYSAANDFPSSKRRRLISSPAEDIRLLNPYLCLPFTETNPYPFLDLMPPPTKPPSSGALPSGDLQATSVARSSPVVTRERGGPLARAILPVVDLTGDSPELQPMTAQRRHSANAQTSDLHGQTWSEFLQDRSSGGQGSGDASSRSSPRTNRKRRLASAGDNSSQPERVRSSIPGGPSSAQPGLSRHASRARSSFGTSTTASDNGGNVGGLFAHLVHLIGSPFLANSFLIHDDEEDVNQPPSSSSRQHEQQYQFSNQALGGGEEVRLCNPCVPDPNPEPPRRYSIMESTGRQRSSNVTGNRPHISLSSSSLRSSEIYEHLPSFHRPSASLGSASFINSEAARELRRHRARMTYHPETSGLHHTNEAGMGGRRLPSYDAVDYAFGTTSPAFPPSYRQSQDVEDQVQFPTSSYSPRTASALDYQQCLNYSPAYSLSQRTQIHHDHHRHPQLDASRPLPHPPRQRPSQRIDEADLCPICNRMLPPQGRDGNEEARETHIRGCIRSHSDRHGATSDRHSSPPPGSGQMVHFTATEKDCISQDGTSQECTICMEEYEVGVELTRLLCFCKFHKSCIVGWFKRKEECPVHKVLA
ncbi:hypothetical protein CIRG_04277 [Coccidioides immitis RMSCC 2394]|uniref:RING-type E3 ubiquitin transferase n=1 Tax=Coccidioides immitis RMSCC 2394 TaxID=404692 RepID=A0A0J6Y7F6_COCIT|nr:hypothetical protein CIRG_04277 [Coccidioides immitis RMSCC 2394]